MEDDKDFLSILKIKFISDGFSVVVAEDGEEGINMANKEQPDLIVSDILMTRMDGIEMAKKIKASNKNLSILFLTNMNDQEHVKIIEELGFDYLVKAELRINDIVDKVKEKLNIK